MKNIILLIVVLILTGCEASTPVKLHNLGDVDQSKISILTSYCSKECKAAIEKDGNFKNAFSSTFGTSIAGITIQSVNQILGSTSYTSNCGGSGNYDVFNSSWDWSFKLELAPGNNVIYASVDNCNIRNRTLHILNLKLKAGHKYALVAVSRKIKGSGYYEYQAIEWYPALYDYMSGKVVSGQSEYGWLKP